jgi:hypothetical protein
MPIVKKSFIFVAFASSWNSFPKIYSIFFFCCKFTNCFLACLLVMAIWFLIQKSKKQNQSRHYWNTFTGYCRPDSKGRKEKNNKQAFKTQRHERRVWSKVLMRMWSTQHPFFEIRKTDEKKKNKKKQLEKKKTKSKQSVRRL